MSVNKFGEVELYQRCTDHGNYFITRDRAGCHVLRKDSFCGKELFAAKRDDGRKNTKTGRVTNVSLLYDVIEKLIQGQDN